MKLYKPLSYSIKDGEPIIEGYTMKKPEAINRNEHGFFNTVLDKLNYKQNIKLWQQSKVAVKVDGRLSSFINIEVGFNIQQMDAKVDIDFLADRIEVRKIAVPFEFRFVKRAFLLPAKETKCDGTCADNECICDDLQECLEIVDKKSYSIEEVEKAIVDAYNNNRIWWTWDSIKKQIINNLKTKTK